MIVCLCYGVTDHEIRAQRASGCTSVADVADSCGAGSCCGSCVHAIRDLLVEGTGVQSAAHGDRTEAQHVAQP